MTDTSVTDSVHALYRAHHGWLLARPRRKLGCALDAADLTQDTFVRVLGQPSAQLREPRAFLTTIAHGLMVNHLRRRDLERACLDALAHLPAELAPSAEERTLLLEELLAIDAMLKGLPAPVRRAFLLWQIEERTHAQIAAQLGVSVSSVRQYIHKATVHCLLAAGLP